METANNLTAYCYKANDNQSYYALAEYVAKSVPAKLTLISPEQTIIVEPIDNSAAILAVGNFIDDNALNFHIEPIEPAEESLTGVIAEITEKLNSAETLKEIYRKDAETNKKYWLDSVSENGRIKEQVRAIATLMAGIFPETKY